MPTSQVALFIDRFYLHEKKVNIAHIIFKWMVYCIQKKTENKEGPNTTFLISIADKAVVQISLV